MHAAMQGVTSTMQSSFTGYLLPYQLVIVLVLSTLCVDGQQQYFRIKPKDVRVHEGREATLHCEVTNQAGQVQWTKDGFALGFSAVIPGFPRYSVIGDGKSGVYNLRISNASLEDDAEYQCQVGPGKFIKAIRANARLSVISPPSSIEIVNHSANAKLEIRENQEFQLECQVKNSKPAAKVVWYRGNVELKLDKREDTTVEVESADRKSKRFTVTSRIKLQPTAEDDYADYTCEARHEALPSDMPLRVTVQLSVQYPPGVPYIEGYTEGETIRRGQSVELSCRSRGGNPPAQLIWYKNDEQIRMAYRTNGRLSENIYTFTADSSDNKAKYRCEASNIMSPAPLKTEIALTVLFAPAQVTITGATEARVGDSVPLTCTTANSNPPAEIKWMVSGKHVRNATGRTVVSPDGGWVTSSNISVPIGPNKRSLVVICHGLNMQLTENVVSTHTINVLYPPSQPIIHGYEKGSNIVAGTITKIACTSSGGNPLATVAWYKNDKPVNSVTKVNDQNRSVTSEVTIVTNVTDNEARYKCEATNSASEIPLFETVTLNVHFPPEHVHIRKEPTELKTGVKATLTCDSSSSNPEARLSWWREGIPVAGLTNTTKPGLHGGKLSSIALTLDIKPELNGIVYTCQATNEALQRSVHDAITLEVLYKPMFDTAATADTQIGIEGQPLVLAVEAKGNPTSIAYTWTKDGKKATLAEGPVLNITKLRKEDSGVFKCEAVNSEGSSFVKINLTVQYSATIKPEPSAVFVNPGEDAQLYCVAEGNPLTENHISWRREGFSDEDMESRTSKSYRNGTSFLAIHQPTKEDNGPFECVVNNGIGNQSTKSVYLVVKYKPEIDTSPQISKAASNTGDMARLVCRASGAPKVRFVWSREGGIIPVNQTEKYFTEYHQVDLVTYETVLLVKHVRSSDYGGFECVARNDIGFATTTIRLDVTSAPDPPSALTVLNVTHDSVTISWIPGFDGGMEPSYRLRYRLFSNTEDGYRYVDVLTPNATSFVLTGLAMATDYTVSIMAFNKLGSSKYLPDLLKARTSNEAPPSFHSPSQDEQQGGGLVVLIATIVGTAVLVLNVILIGCCLHRRANKRLTGHADRQQAIDEILLGKGDIPRQVIIGVALTAGLLVVINVIIVFYFIYKKRSKRLKEAASEQSSSKSATIEMYAPSSYNETVTGETLSSVSEKSESYSNGDGQGEYLEDGTKAAASTYLIDQMEYPYTPYPNYEMQHQPKLHQEEVQQHDMSRNTYNHGIDAPKLHYSSVPATHAVDGPYYNISPDARYIPYPAQMEFSHVPQGVGNTGSLRRPQHRGPVVPPDVTVSHTLPPQHHLHNGPSVLAAHHLPPAPMLSTFNPGLNYPPTMEQEGHLV